MFKDCRHSSDVTPNNIKVLNQPFYRSDEDLIPKIGHLLIASQTSLAAGCSFVSTILDCITSMPYTYNRPESRASSSKSNFDKNDSKVCSDQNVQCKQCHINYSTGLRALISLREGCHQSSNIRSYMLRSLSDYIDKVAGVCTVKRTHGTIYRDAISGGQVIYLALIF